jgi:septum site-determining protein MinC
MSADLVHGGMFTVMVVQVDDPNDANLESRLAEQVSRSPAFFANAPVVIDLKNATGLATADAFQALKRLFKRQHLIAVGITNANGTQVRAAMNADLAAFPSAGGRSVEMADSGPPAAPEARALPEAIDPRNVAAPMGAKTKIVTQPVRSGTQIYARGTDLIVLSSVSPGAEVIADGHVHIYGALRGRAIAGASGDTEARIFTSRLDAELLCVAGQYLVSEAIGAEFRDQPAQIGLTDGALVITRDR